MKSITMDFETYQCELREKQKKGANEALTRIQYAVEQIAKGDLNEAQCILIEDFENEGHAFFEKICGLFKIEEIA